MVSMLVGPVVLLIITLTYATVTDLRYRRIPNRLTLPMLAGGLILHTVQNGQAGTLESLTGMGAALAIMILPFALNWVGGGDVKLAMVVGALMGLNFLIITLLFAGLVAGIMAVAEIVQRRELVTTARYLLLSWYLPVPKSLALKTKLPYAPAIAIGSIVALASMAVGAFSLI